MISHMAATISATEAQSVLALLGGRKLLGLSNRAQPDYVELLRRGLPYGALTCVTARLELSLKDLEGALHLSPRTLHRRKPARLNPVESERIMRLARVAARAQEVLGDLPTALDWLLSPNRALDAQRPLGLLDTDVGTDQVLELLGRIDNDLFS